MTFVMSFCEESLSYNQNHGPFEEDEEPKSFEIHELDYLKPGDPNLRVKNSRIMVFCQKDKEYTPKVHLMDCPSVYGGTSAKIFDSQGELVFAPQKISEHCTAQDAYLADLNRDNKDDFIIRVWTGGCGLAIHNCDIAFILSGERGYKCTRVRTIAPGLEDFVDLKGDGNCQFIHTAFENVSKCNDGTHHNFWVYNILSFEEDQVKVNNNLQSKFPKIIWFTYKPNHKETSIITDEQKKEVRKKSLKNIFIEDVYEPSEKPVQKQEIIEPMTVYSEKPAQEQEIIEPMAVFREVKSLGNDTYLVNLHVDVNENLGVNGYIIREFYYPGDDIIEASPKTMYKNDFRKKHGIIDWLAFNEFPQFSSVEDAVLSYKIKRNNKKNEFSGKWSTNGISGEIQSK